MRKTTLSLLCLLLCSLSLAQEGGQPTGHHAQTVDIGGLQYCLNQEARSAMVANGNSWEGELEIPETVVYEDETYTVEAIEWLAFSSCKTLTRVRIPRTVLDIVHYDGYEDCKNPFVRCTGLERIEVDVENPAMCSVDGVLFSKDKTRLYCYPAGAKGKAYSVPDGVTWMGGDAFAYNNSLASVTMPNSVTHLSFGAFSNCQSLESVKLSESLSHIAAYTFEKCESLHFLDIPSSVSSFGESLFRWSPIKTLVIRGAFPDGFRYDTFYFMDAEVAIYVQQSEVEKLKSELAKLRSFGGTVLPLEAYHTAIDMPLAQPATISIHDLQGRRLSGTPRRGLYISGGRKLLVK